MFRIFNHSTRQGKQCYFNKLFTKKIIKKKNIKQVHNNLYFDTTQKTNQKYKNIFNLNKERIKREIN